VCEPSSRRCSAGDERGERRIRELRAPRVEATGLAAHGTIATISGRGDASASASSLAVSHAQRGDDARAPTTRDFAGATRNRSTEERGESAAACSDQLGARPIA
jgi:hypothetical protein